MAKKVFRAEAGRDLPAAAPEQAYAKDELTGELKPVSETESAIPTTPISGQQQVVTTPTSGQEQTVTTPQSNYLYDWNNTSILDAYNQGKHSKYALALDKSRWAKDTGNTFDWWEVTAVAPEHDLTKSKEQNEKEERRKKWEDASEQLGYMLTNLGNFIGAGLGAPEPTNAPDSTKLTERQQRLRDKTEELRRAYNKDWYQAVTKQQSEQRQLELARHKTDYENRRLDQYQQQLDRQDADLYLRQRKQDWQEKFQQGKLDVDRERLRIQEDYNRGRLSQGAARIAIQELNAETSRMKETTPQTVETTDSRGRKTVKTTYRERKAQQATGRKKIDY